MNIQIERESGPTRGPTLPLAILLGSALALSGCGDDQAASPAAPVVPRTPASAPKPAPPATPQGLALGATGQNFIEWSWSAVEGANAYAIQVGADAAFDDDDAIRLVLTTKHRESGLQAGATRHLRVAAARVTDPATLGTDPAQPLNPATTLLGAWGPPVKGVAGEAPQPEKPAETPTGTPPEPEPEPDPEPEPPVSSGGGGGGGPAGPAVVPSGLTLSLPGGESEFLIPDDSADAGTATATVNPAISVYAEAPALIAPLNFAAGVDPVEVEAGDNTPFALLDWIASQRTVIEEGVTFEITWPDSAGDEVAYVTCGPFACAEGRDAPEITLGDSGECDAWEPTLDLHVGRIHNGGTSTAAVGPSARGIDLGWEAGSDVGFEATHSVGGASVTSELSTASTLRVPTVGASGSGIWGSSSNPCETDYQSPHSKPAECFRVAIAEDRNSLASYTVVLEREPIPIDWGAVGWEELDVGCEPATFSAAAQVDVCDLLAEEVGNLGGMTAIPKLYGDPTRPVDLYNAGVIQGRSIFVLWGFNFAIELPRSKRFTGLMHRHQKGNGTVNLYSSGRLGRHSERWLQLLDSGWEDVVGDFGLVDLYGDDSPDNLRVLPHWWRPELVETCSAEDGGAAGGTLCDAEEVVLADSVTFVDGLGLGCSKTLDFSLTCDWDADGGVTLSPGEARRNGSSDIDDYLSCTLEKN